MEEGDLRGRLVVLGESSIVAQIYSALQSGPSQPKVTMEYLIFAAALALVLGVWVMLRSRGPRNPMKTVDRFSKAREALKPERKKPRT